MKRAYLFLIAAGLILVMLGGCGMFDRTTASQGSGSLAEPDAAVVQTDPEKDPADRPEESASAEQAGQPAIQADPETVEVFMDSPVFADLNGDGETTEITLADDDDNLSLHTAQGDSQYEISFVDLSIGYFMNAYYVKSYDGYPFFVVSYDYCSDDFETKAMNFSGAEPKEIFKTPLYVDWIDEFGFEAYGYLQSAGTWAVRTHAYFVQNGIEWRGTYVLDRSAPSYTKVRTAMELPVQILVSDAYIESSLPPGTVLGFMATDGESYMDFELEDGTKGRLNFVWNENWIEEIDDIPIYEYFVDLPQFG